MTYNVFSGTLNPTHFTSLQCSDAVYWRGGECALCGLSSTKHWGYIQRQFQSTLHLIQPTNRKVLT